MAVECSLRFVILTLSMTPNGDTTTTAALQQPLRTQTVALTTQPPPVLTTESTAIETARNASANLQARLRDLPAARGKVPLDPFRNTAFKLDFFFKIYMVYGVNDASQTLTMSSYVEMRWSDPALTWNPSDYNGVNDVELPSDAVWTPQVILVNSVNVYDLLYRVISLRVNSSGVVFAQLPLFMETSCPMEMSRYPYDEQYCPVIFYSLTQAIDWNIVDNVKIQKMAKSFELSSEWDLVGVSHEVVEMLGERVVRYVIHLRRKTTFYTLFVVCPLVTTSYLNTFVFLIPPESGEKMSFLVSIFVSGSVFLGFFTDVMPRGLNSIPSIVTILMIATIESVLIILASICILRRFHRHDEKTEVKFTETGNEGMASDRRRPLRMIKTGGIADKLCCNRRSFTNIVQVSPSARALETLANQVEKEDRLTKYEGGGSIFRELTVPELDRWCFVVAIISNTVFICSVLAYSLISSKLEEDV